MKTLGITPDAISFTSDFFPKLMEFMEQFIKEGFAYADDTPSEEVNLTLKKLIDEEAEK